MLSSNYTSFKIYRHSHVQRQFIIIITVGNLWIVMEVSHNHLLQFLLFLTCFLIPGNESINPVHYNDMICYFTYYVFNVIL